MSVEAFMEKWSEEAIFEIITEQIVKVIPGIIRKALAGHITLVYPATDRTFHSR